MQQLYLSVTPSSAADKYWLLVQLALSPVGPYSGWPLVRLALIPLALSQSPPEEHVIMCNFSFQHGSFKLCFFITLTILEVQRCAFQKEAILSIFSDFSKRPQSKQVGMMIS
jgi:hypothetical protein